MKGNICRDEKVIKRLFILWVPLIGYMGLIYLLSSWPSPKYIPKGWNIDKLIHFAEYGILGILWFRALKSFKGLSKEGFCFILALALTILFGITDELHQSFVPNRVPSILDVIADSIGGVCGLWFYRRFKCF